MDLSNNQNNVVPNNGFDEEDISFNWLEWLMRIVRHWYLFVIAVILALFFAYVKNRSWQPLYVTEAKVMIEEGASNQYNFMQGFGVNQGYRNMNNQLLLLGSYDLIRKTVEKLPFSIDIYSQGRFKTNSLFAYPPIEIKTTFLAENAYGTDYQFVAIDSESFEILIKGNKISKDEIIKGRYNEPVECSRFFITIHKLRELESQTSFFFRFRTINSLESEFAGRLALNYVGDQSSVIALSLVGNDVERDKVFLDALSEEFLANNLEKKNSEAIRTIDFINDQLGYLLDSLNFSESQLRDFRRKNNIIDVNAYSGSLMAKLDGFNQKRSELDLKDAYFNYLSNYLTKNIKEESIVAPSSLGVSDPTLLELVTQFNDLQLERSQIGEKNPNYKRVTENIEKIRQALFEVLKNVKAVNNLERKNFDQQCAEIQSEIDLLPAKEHQMINFERKYKINDNYYTFLLQKRSEAQIRKASNVSDNVILQRARVTSLINSDKKSKTYITFLVIGLLIPFAFIILKELLNFTIRTETDLQKLTKYPIIGQIRHTNNLTPVLTVKSPKSAFTESFRVIRTRLEFITKRKTGVFIMVTSAEPHDGKTYFSANLSGVYGLANQKVLLIDMDLRNPNVSKLFELSTTKGLVDYLINNATLNEITKKNLPYGFDVIPVGTVPPNPGDLIRSEELKQLLSQLKT
ncbi:MAG TPA: hypothetical protein PLB75_05810, partial [Paludibacteraceae bacterium]|nr:hypothetical protein [Paludibacteraceae bacterium]